MATQNSTGTSFVWTPANVVTCVRIALIPLLIVLMLLDWASHDIKMYVVAFLFLLISLTDGLDGYLARSRGEVTVFGQFMDPIADKLLVVSTMVSMVEMGIVPAWVPVIIVAREFMISGLRMVVSSAGTVLAASMIGKAKTLVTMVAIVLFFLKDTAPAVFLGLPVQILAWLAMTAAVVLTLVSMIDYYLKCWPVLMGAPGSASNTKTDVTAPGAAQSGALVVTSKACPGNAPVPSEGAERYCDPARGHEHGLLLQVEAEAVCLIETARQAGLRLGTAESLTAGMISAALTSVPGSSDVVAGGVASYMTSVKESVLHVDPSVTGRYGVVSEQTAAQMAAGACALLDADLCVAVTGVAGPGGGGKDCPVGTVCFAVVRRGGTAAPARCADYGRPHTVTDTQHFHGDRASVRTQTVLHALQMLRREVLAGMDTAH